MQLFEDRICAGGPLERLAVGVVRRNEVFDALHEWIVRFLFQVLEQPSPTESRLTVQRAVAVFVAAYGPPQG